MKTEINSIEDIFKFDPCKEAKDWIYDQSNAGFSIEEMYQNCVRGDWLHWIRCRITAYAAYNAYAADAYDADAYDAAAHIEKPTEIRLKQANQIKEKYPTLQSWIDSIGKERFSHW